VYMYKHLVNKLSCGFTDINPVEIARITGTRQHFYRTLF